MGVSGAFRKFKGKSGYWYAEEKATGRQFSPGFWTQKSEGEVKSENSIAVSVEECRGLGRTQFSLGDFAKLGDFLAEVIGSEHQSFEANGN